jgi:hypothetical protein
MNARYQLSKILLVAALLFSFGPVNAVHAYELAARSSQVGVASLFSGVEVPSEYSKGSTYKTITVLKIDPLKTYSIGEQPVVTAHLTNDAGAPLARQLIRVFSYKNRVDEGLTDATGTAQIPLHFNLYPGTYDLLAVYNGSELDALAQATAFGLLSVVPGKLDVETVPPLAGVRFKLGDQTLTTDSTGKVQFAVDHIGSYRIEVLPLSQSSDPNTKVSFDRWNNNDVSTYHEFKYPVHRPLQAGFLISYLVNFKYTDKANQPVDPGRISLTRLRNAGTFFSLKDPTSAWLPTNRILHRVGGFLESKPAVYYLDGVNIFQVNQGSTWWIQLFLYPASFSAHDALFRTPIGSGILLEYPDGARRELAFDPSSSSVRVDSLPRGIYHASVKGAQGLEPLIPLSLSRGREFNLSVISRLDLAIIIGVPLLGALVFLLIGRTNLFYRPARDRAAAPGSAD